MSEADRELLLAYKSHGWGPEVRLEDVRRALDAGAPVNPPPDSSGRTPLRQAIARDSVEQVRLLLDRGARAFLSAEELDEQKKRKKFHTGEYCGDTPIFSACVFQSTPVDIVRLLLEHGASVNLSTRYVTWYREVGRGRVTSSQTPLSLACYNTGRPEVVRLLLEYGSEVNFANEEGETSLHRRPSQGYVESARLLLDYGAEIDVVETSMGWTPLHYAVTCNEKPLADVDLTTLLLSRGANFLLENNEGESPLSLVHEWCHGEMRGLWEDFLPKYYKLHVDLLVFGRAGPIQPRRLVTEFLAAWPTYEDY